MNGVLTPTLSVLDSLRVRHNGAVASGITPGLLTDDAVSSLPAARLADGSAIPDLLLAAQRHWPTARRHVAVALAWKAYTYWVTLPAVVGYAAAGQVPDVSAGNVMLRLTGTPSFVEVGLRTATVAVRPGDRSAGRPGVVEVTDLARYLRERLLDQHLAPIVQHLSGVAHLGRRTLRGAIASGVAHALVRAQEELPDPAPEVAGAMLRVLDLDDLVEVTADLRVHRHTCCLAFTLPDPKVCRGCCLPR